MILIYMKGDLARSPFFVDKFLSKNTLNFFVNVKAINKVNL